VRNMDQETIAWLLTLLQNESGKLKLTENEKLFIFSIGFTLKIFITSNEVYYPEEGSPYSGYYARQNIKYLVKIYNILGKRIAIGKILKDIADGKIRDFDYVQDVLQIFYKEYLTENEKTYINSLLKNLSKKLLEYSRDITDLERNIDYLFEFFKIMYHVTDKTFRYDEKVVFELLETNKYDKNEDFFDSLSEAIIQLKTRNIESYEIIVEFINNIIDLLSEMSEDFVKSMAKSLIK